MHARSLLKYKTVVETIQTHPIELNNGVGDYSLTFRIEIVKGEEFYSAILWRLERYDFSTSFSNEEASELVFILDETTITDIEYITNADKDVVKNLVLAALEQKFFNSGH